MSNVPKVLIIGRPNVGKSTLMNRITETRRSITAEESGVTRDIREYPAFWNGKSFMLLDSGGLLLHKGVDDIQSKIEQRVFDTIESVDKIVFLVDSRSGFTSVEDSIIKVLRTYQDKVLLVVNKCDNPAMMLESQEFYKAGFGEPIAISAMQGYGVADLLDLLVNSFSSKEEALGHYKDARRIAIVGRPNVGKSSLLNAIVNETKSIVHDMSGTTRDTVEVLYTYHGQDYLFLDTAGIRRRAKIRDTLEYFSILRSDNSIAYADLVILVLDATLLITDQDKKIINFVIENKRNMIVFVNKWDTMERSDMLRQDCTKLILQGVPALQAYPILFGSATERLSLGKLVNLIGVVIDQSMRRVPTSDLNRFIEDVMLRQPPKSKKGKRLAVYYVTQAEVGPPTFVFFINDTSLISMAYRRFLEKQLREFFGGLEGVAIRMKFKSKQHLRSSD